MKVMISQALVDEMLAAAQAAMPEECCGLLVGDKTWVEHLIPAQNVAASPRTQFEIAPATLLAAHRTHRGRITGHYHSHPTGDVVPSQTDKARADAVGTLWLIIAGGKIKAHNVLSPQCFAECEIVVT